MGIMLIAAMGKNREIGKAGKLIWQLKGDLKFFKEVTMRSQGMLMGSKTFESLPKILPGREHYVLTKHPEELEKIIESKEGDRNTVHVVTDLEKFISDWREKRPETDMLCVIGGGMVYWETVKYATAMLLTEVDAEEEAADTFFPEFDRTEWKRRVVEEHTENGIHYTVILYEKKGMEINLKEVL